MSSLYPARFSCNGVICFVRRMTSPLFDMRRWLSHFERSLSLLYDAATLAPSTAFTPSGSFAKPPHIITRGAGYRPATATAHRCVAASEESVLAPLLAVLQQAAPLRGNLVTAGRLPRALCEVCTASARHVAHVALSPQVRPPICRSVCAYLYEKNISPPSFDQRSLGLMNRTRELSLARWQTFRLNTAPWTRSCWLTLWDMPLHP